MMSGLEVIKKKRNGDALTRGEIQFLIDGFLKGEIPDYQMSAFLMAVYFTGMNPEETASLTDVMLRSGSIVDLSSVPGRKVDKHSTGGVGDKVSLILAPMVAACGVPVPMVSGRGLGHTGGTLDKLESIPGFRTDLSVEEFCRAVSETGLVLAGQTEAIAPADRKLYALRDVTATIESFPLIAGSIMSKKLAEGIDALVLDVKFGNGAFMRSCGDAERLAEMLVSIGDAAGKDTVAFLTEMEQPLGFAIGNWPEVVEAVDCLRGKDVTDLMEVVYVLGGAMVFLAGKAVSIEEGMALCKAAIWSGGAYGKFLEIVKWQGGDIRYLEDTQVSPPPRHTARLRSSAGGFLTGFDTSGIGMVATRLGAGRWKLDESVDPRAGIVLAKKRGDPVEKDEVLAVLQTDREGVLEDALAGLTRCISIGETKVPSGSCVRSMVDREGVRPWSTPELH
ncbi:MAG: thymidine phosphorylase [Bacteroidota bacterium]